MLEKRDAGNCRCERELTLQGKERGTPTMVEVCWCKRRGWVAGSVYYFCNFYCVFVVPCVIVFSSCFSFHFFVLQSCMCMIFSPRSL